MEAILNDAFGDIMLRIPRKATAQLVATHPLLRNGIISSTRSAQPNIERFTDHICRAVQSETKIGIEDIQFSLVTFRPNELQVRGEPGGRSSTKCLRLGTRQALDIKEWAGIKSSIINPLAGISERSKRLLEGKCLMAALAIQLFHIANPRLSSKDLKAYRHSGRLIEDVDDLCRELAMEGGDETNLYDLQLLAPLLAVKDIGVALFDNDSAPFLRINSDCTHQAIIFIVYVQSCLHAYAVRCLRSFFATRWACYKCLKGGEKGGGKAHKCPKSLCPLCQYADCGNRSAEKENFEPLFCDNGCAKTFWSSQCLASHIPSCTSRQICPTCFISIPQKTGGHKCGQSYCPLCTRTHSPLAQCFVSKGRATSIGESKVFYGDFETWVDPESQQHRVNLAVIQDSTGAQEWIYTGFNSLECFIHDLIRKKSPFSNSYFVFHNGSNFDYQFLVGEMLRLKLRPSGLLIRGQKIIGLELTQNRIRFRDSLLFIQATPLSSFPSMFSLQSGPKGTFPHRLNTPQFIKWPPAPDIPYSETTLDGKTHYFPLLSYFHPENLSSAALKKLTVWHREQSMLYGPEKKLYFPRAALVDYCKSDVQILRLGFEKFRAGVTEQYPECEPLCFITLPSLNSAIYR